MSVRNFFDYTSVFLCLSFLTSKISSRTWWTSVGKVVLRCYYSLQIWASGQGSWDHLGCLCSPSRCPLFKGKVCSFRKHLYNTPCFLLLANVPLELPSWHRTWPFCSVQFPVIFGLPFSPLFLSPDWHLLLFVFICFFWEYSHQPQLGAGQYFIRNKWWSRQAEL